eukprot:353182-Chlamydomonas_euryale.AAC.58
MRPDVDTLSCTVSLNATSAVRRWHIAHCRSMEAFGRPTAIVSTAGPQVHRAHGERSYMHGVKTKDATEHGTCRFLHRRAAGRPQRCDSIEFAGLRSPAVRQAGRCTPMPLARGLTRLNSGTFAAPGVSRSQPLRSRPSAGVLPAPPLHDVAVFHHHPSCWHNLKGIQVKAGHAVKFVSARVAAARHSIGCCAALSPQSRNSWQPAWPAQARDA